MNNLTEANLILLALVGVLFPRMTLLFLIIYLGEWYHGVVFLFGLFFKALYDYEVRKNS